MFFVVDILTLKQVKAFMLQRVDAGLKINPKTPG